MSESIQSARENAPTTRASILEAAEELFAAKGFDGASVDAIAAAAGVNKATIYYYFENKQAVLDCLIEEFLRTFTALSLNVMQMAALQGVYKDALAIEGDSIRIRDKEGLNRLLGVVDSWIDHILTYFVEHRRILRIMLAESCKDGGNRTLLYRLSDLLNGPGAFSEQMRTMGVDQLSSATMVMKFFGGFLPIAYYAVNAEVWCERYGMDDSALRAGLRQMFRFEIAGYFELLSGN